MSKHTMTAILGLIIIAAAFLALMGGSLSTTTISLWGLPMSMDELAMFGCLIVVCGIYEALTSLGGPTKKKRGHVPDSPVDPHWIIPGD